MNFTNVIKPTHICNLSCKYCYNEDARAPMMSHETLRRVVRETCTYVVEEGLPGVDFIWHGGEPMVAGIDFYRVALEEQRPFSGRMNISNTMQTNGTLIDEEWIRFFVDTQFRVSMSLDGTRDLNDRTRVDRGGGGSFDRIMRGIGLVREAGLALGVAIVLSRSNREHVDEIFDFLVQQKLPFNVIPLTRSGDALSNFEDLGLLPDEYADPWIRLYDRWFDASRDAYVYGSDFGFKTKAILSGRPADCIGSKNCSEHNVSTDPEGYVYPCATMSSDPDWVYGNLTSSTMREILASAPAMEARTRKQDPHCDTCKWQHVCHGGCVSRANKFFGDIHTRDYYCPSLYRMYEHVESRLRGAAGIDLSNLPRADRIDDRHAPPERLLASKSFRRYSKTDTTMTRRFNERLGKVSLPVLSD